MTLALFSDYKRLWLNDTLTRIHNTLAIAFFFNQIFLHTIFGNHFLILNDLRINFPT